MMDISAVSVGFFFIKALLILIGLNQLTKNPFFFVAAWSMAGIFAGMEVNLPEGYTWSSLEAASLSRSDVQYMLDKGFTLGSIVFAFCMSCMLIASSASDKHEDI